MKLTDKVLSKLDKRFGEKKWYNTIKTDYVARTLIFAVWGAFITICFAIFNGVYGIVYKSVWYGAFAIYYIILSLQKSLLLGVYLICYKKHKDNEVKLTREKQKIYLANGVIFIPLTIALTIIISVCLSTGKPSVTGDILAITTAAFTTYNIVMISINMKKAIKKNDFVLQAMRNINLVEVIISIVLLTNTLITTFGTLNNSMRTMIIEVGLVACLSITSLGIFMIIRAIRNLKNREIKS